MQPPVRSSALATMKNELGTPVATRRLKTEISGGPVVELRIGKPRKETSGQWTCPFEIAGLEQGGITFVRAIDALQALVLTFVAARRVLRESKQKFTWIGGEGYDGGLPLSIPEVLGTSFARKIERAVERELSTRVAAGKRRARLLKVKEAHQRPEAAGNK